MNLLWQNTVYEIRLNLRSKSFWFIAMLIVVMVFIPTFALLLIHFVVVSVVTRDERYGFSGILASLQYHTAKLYQARALAVFFILMALWPFMVLTAGFLPGMKPTEWLLNGQHLIFLTVKYITICVTAIGFVFLAGLVTRHPWRLYLITGVCWIFGVLLACNLSCFPSWSELFLFGHGEMGLMVPSVALGYFPQQGLLSFMSAFQITAVVLLIVLVVIYRMAKRSERVLRLKVLLLLIFILVTIVFYTGVNVWLEFERRENGFRLGLQEAAAAKTGVVATPTLESYHLELKLRTRSHDLLGTAIIKLKRMNTPSNIAFFTLRNCFEVADITEMGSGEKLEWRRDGSRLAVYIPKERQGQTLTLAICYWGRVWEWFRGYYARPAGPVNFLAPTFSLLRSGYAWYPIPGIHSLYQCEYYDKPWPGQTGTTLWAKCAVHPPVPFTLTVDIDTDSTVVSNLEQTGVELLTGEYKQRYRFGSLQGRDVFLLTGPYHYEKRKLPGRGGLVEMYCYRQHQAGIDKVLNSLAAPYLFYEDMLQPDHSAASGVGQSGKICTMVEIPPFFFFCENGINVDNLMLTDTVLITEYYFQTEKSPLTMFAGAQSVSMRDIIRDIAILQHWALYDTAGGNSDGILGALLLYLHVLYMEKISGIPYYERDLLIEDGEDMSVIRNVFKILDTIHRSELGEPAIRKIMRGLYQVYVRKGNIDPADFAETVEIVVSEANWLKEKIDEIRQRCKSIGKYIDDLENRKLKFGVNLIISPFNQGWL